LGQDDNSPGQCRSQTPIATHADHSTPRRNREAINLASLAKHASILQGIEVTPLNSAPWRKMVNIFLKLPGYRLVLTTN